MEEKLVCKYCNKELIPLTTRNDRLNRRYHPRCFQLVFNQFVEDEKKGEKTSK